MNALYLILLVVWVGGQITSYAAGGVRVALLDIVLAMALVWWLIRARLSNSVRDYLYRFGPFLAVGVASLANQLGTLTASEIGYSSLYLVRFAIYASVAFIFVKLPLVKRLKDLWFAGIGVGALGLAQYFLYPNLRNLAYLGWDPHEFRVFSTLLDPNFTGIVLVLTLLLGLYLWEKKWVGKWSVVTWSLIILAALFLTYSRGSLLAILIAGGAWLMMKRKIGWLLVGGLVFATILLVLPRPGGEGVNLLRTMSVESRLENSIAAGKLFLTSPIFGHGFDTLRFVRPQVEVTNAIGDLSHSASGYHDSWLFLLATTGIIGLAAYIWIWASFAKNLWHKKPKTKAEKIAVQTDKRFFVIIALALLVHSQFDNSLFYPQVMLWMWVAFS